MFYICLFILHFALIQSQADCPPNILTRNNQLFVISNQSMIYNQAEDQCQLLGGSVARISEEDREYFYPALNLTLLQGLVEVKIYNKTTVHNDKVDPPLTYDYHKYRADGCSAETTSLDGYDRPGIGDLSSIWLRSHPEDNKVTFCYYPTRDIVRQKCNTAEGWKDNFKLYEETNQSNNTIMLYNYYAETAGATSKFSLNEINGSHWTTDFDDGISFIYLKDISVFIGARSDVNQKKWYWNNNTEVNNPMFPESNSSLCQQMTWPLTYNDGINLHPKQCETGMSHYVCRINFSVMLEEVSCNATVLELTWNSFENVSSFQSSNTFSIEVNLTSDSSNSTTQIFTVAFNQSSYIITNLVQRTNYTAEVSYKSMDCPILQVAASSSGRTGYGVPDPVTSAYVNNTYNQCKIIWTHDTTDNNIESYVITFQINSTNVDKTIVNASESNMDYDVDLSQFKYNKTLSFFIQAISNCNETSNKMEVNGTCITPLPTTTISTTTATTTTPTHTTKTVTSPPSRETTETMTSPPNQETTAENEETPVTPSSLPDCLPHGSTDGLYDGALIGIGIVIGFFIAVLGGSILYSFYWRKNRKQKENDVSMTSSSRSRGAGCFENPSNIHNTTTDMSLFPTEANNESSFENEALKLSSTKQNHEYENVALLNLAISLEKVAQTFLDGASTGFKNFKIEFEKIQKLSLENEKQHNIATENKALNRYKNVYPYDDAIVPLKSLRYINASYIEGFNHPNKYIATQGPKPKTINDFWEMIWNENVSIIVMLCKCKENNKTKCENYWPPKNALKTCNDLMILLQVETTYQNVIKREMILSNMKQEERKVVQFQYTGWPDHGIPYTTTSMYKLRRMVNSEYNKLGEHAPIVVHCSAGAGRTGTYIAIDNLIQELKETKKINVMQAVLKMRENRKEMIQSVKQYVFVYKMVIELSLLPETHIRIFDIPQNVENSAWLNKHSSEEFAALSNPATSKSIVIPSNQSLEESQYANCEENSANQIFFYVNNNRLVMDAHLVQLSSCSEDIIVASQPQPGKEDQFLEMILFRNVKHVVSLEKKDCLTLQLPSKDESKMIGNMEVVTESVNDYQNQTSYRLNLFSKSNPRPSSVTYTVQTLVEDCNSSKVSQCLEIWNEIKASMQNHKGSPVLLYCKEGSSKCGIFLTLMVLVEQIKQEEEVDVFRVVKDLKDYRPKLIQHEKTYKECYVLLNKYLKQQSRNSSTAIYENVKLIR